MEASVPRVPATTDGGKSGSLGKISLCPGEEGGILQTAWCCWGLAEPTKVAQYSLCPTGGNGVRMGPRQSSLAGLQGASCVSAAAAALTPFTVTRRIGHPYQNRRHRRKKLSFSRTSSHELESFPTARKYLREGLQACR